MILDIWDHIVNDPLYLGILVAALVQFTLIVLLTMATLAVAAGRHYVRIAGVRTRAALTGPLLAALEDASKVDAFVQHAKRFPAFHVSRFLIDQLGHLTEEHFQRIVSIYTALGYVQHDLRLARSPMRFQRVLAAQRLVALRSAASRGALVSLIDEGGAIGLMAFEGVCHIGMPDDIVHALKRTRVLSRVARSNLVRCLECSKNQTLLAVVAHLQDFDDPQVRRVVLETGAKRLPQESIGPLRAALKSREKEDRIGGAVGLATAAAAQALPDLWNLCSDPDWEVRSAVASALGRLGHPAAVPHLARMLDDFSFWVRHNAAWALAQLGDPGREQLRVVLDSHVDKFARDAARDALEAMSLQRVTSLR